MRKPTTLTGFPLLHADLLALAKGDTTVSIPSEQQQTMVKLLRGFAPKAVDITTAAIVTLGSLTRYETERNQLPCNSTPEP